MKNSEHYETYELRRQSGRHLLEGLIIAAMFHGMLIGGLTALFQYLEPAATDRPIDKDGTGILIENWPMQPPGPKIPGGARPTIEVPSVPIIVADADAFELDSITAETLTDASWGTGEPSGLWSGEGTMTGSFGGGGGGTSDEEREPEPFTAVEKEPVALLDPAPVYPEIAVRAGLEGTVYVKMWVGRDGSVKRAEVVKSSSEFFNESALAAAHRWTFSPAIMNQTPVSVWVTVPFRFRLR